MSALSFLRTATTAGLALVLGTVVATSCATPEFDFGDGPSTTKDTTGGSGGGSNGGSGGIFGDGGSAGDGSGGTSPVPHCKNGKLDPGETDTDCGGNDCAPCRPGSDCEVAADCTNDSCWGGKCQLPTCTDTFKNDSETDVDCGGECPACETDKRCLKGSDCESLVCSGGKCKAPTCSDRKKNQSEVDVDCGGECPGCDVGQDCVLDPDCRAADPDTEFPGTPKCDQESLTCELVCATPQDDCNQKAADGCETNTNSDSDHCGGCGVKCAPPHATPQCVAGSCGIQVCAPGFKDVDGIVDNGCEVNHLTDPDFCGTTPDNVVKCADVANPNGVAACSNGVCTITCAAGFDDCNNDVSDGCEANLDKDVNNCTACNNQCIGGTNLSPFCDPATAATRAGDPCGTTPCAAGLGDCDGDGQCTNSLAGTPGPAGTILNCGQCGNTCATSNGTPACAGSSGSSQCSIATCNPDWKDCDGAFSNGCEENLKTSAKRCGGCLSSDANSGSGKDCTLVRDDPTKHVASIACDTGTCKILSCQPDWGDCNGTFNDGCEVNLKTSTTHCGACSNSGTPSGGMNCSNYWENADGTCSNGLCAFSSCDANRGDCDNDKDLGEPSNGCETTTTNNNSHCGGCGLACTKNANTQTNTCTGTTCVPSCVAGWCPAANPRNGCTAQLGTAANCTTCGEVCGASAPFCEAGVGCKSYKKIRLVQSQTVQLPQPNGPVSGTTTNTFAVGSAATGHRLLVVGVSSIGNPGHVEPTSVTYGTNKTLTQLTEANETTAAKYAALYYLKECDLAAAGDQKVTVTLPAGNGNGAVYFHAVLFENVEQTLTSVTPSVTSNTQTVSLPGPAPAGSPVAIPVDGWFFGAASGQQSAFSVTAPAGQTQVSAIGGAASHKAIVTAWGPMPANTYTFTWTATWDALAAVGMPLVPAKTPAGTCP